MSDINTSMLRQWFEEVWNKNNESAIDRLMFAKAKIIDKYPASTYPDGTDHIKIVFKKLHRDFQDLHFDVGKVHSEGDTETADCIVTATYKAKKIRVKGPATIRVKNGKIVEASNDFDNLLYGAAGEL